MHKCPFPLTLLLLAAILGISCFFGLRLGYLSVTAEDIVAAFRLHLAGGETGALGAMAAIWDLRLPRVILSLAVGMGLSLSGILMQAMFRNPMADPYIMGVSSGASLGAVCAIFLGWGVAFGAASIGIGAFLGALALSLVLAMAAGKEADTSYLLIFGAALAAVSGGFSSVLIFAGANSTGMDVTLYWLMGSVSFAKLLPSVVVLGIVISFVFAFSMQSRILDLMLEGEEAAIPLGRRLLPFRRVYLIGNALLCGVLVTQAGLIGFVGLLVPHLCRMVVGAGHRRLLPFSVLVGGIFTVWADILGRIIAPGVDIPLGVTMALLGAPVFIWMLIRKSYCFREEGL